MDTQAGLPLWVLLAVPLLGLAVVGLLRWVAPGELLVVCRRGVVARLHGPGPAWRLPWVEHTAAHPEELTGTPLAVRARTRDGRRVFLGLEADLRTLPPVLGEPYVAPADTAEEVVARVVADTVATIEVHELPEGLVAQLPRLRDEADRTTRCRGVAVAALEIAQLDVILDLDIDAADPTARGPG
jgi:regulator of protease activity HflC (stomatin/prohibitin superfamily)